MPRKILTASVYRSRYSVANFNRIQEIHETAQEENSFMLKRFEHRFKCKQAHMYKIVGKCVCALCKTPEKIEFMQGSKVAGMCVREGDFYVNYVRPAGATELMAILPSNFTIPAQAEMALLADLKAMRGFVYVSPGETAELTAQRLKHRAYIESLRKTTV